MSNHQKLFIKAALELIVTFYPRLTKKEITHTHKRETLTNQMVRLREVFAPPFRNSERRGPEYRIKSNGLLCVLQRCPTFATITFVGFFLILPEKVSNHKIAV